MSQTPFTTQPLSAPPRWSEPDKAVAVGIDGSERNHAAIAWAAAEAALGRRPLLLVHVLDERRVPSPFHRLETDDQHAWRLLDSVESELRRTAPALVVRKDVPVGHVATSLVERTAGQSELVVGRRGAGAFRRLLLGSTSLDAASRAQVPVIVVPDRWSGSENASAPVVVGVDRRRAQPDVFHYAFTQARTRRVALIAAHGRGIPDADRRTPRLGTSETGPVESDDPGAIAGILEPYRTAFPDVDVAVLDRAGHPLAVLLDDVGTTQLLVLGRRDDHQQDRFAFGSVAHGVLHYAEVPVAIVPPRH